MNPPENPRLLPSSSSFRLPQGPYGRVKWELLRFLVVGGTMFIIYVGLSTLLIGAAGLPAGVGSAVAYLALVLPAFLLHHRISFDSRTERSIALKRYIILQLASIIGASASAQLIETVLQSPALLISIVAACAAVAVNFLVLKFWVFKER